MRQNLIIDLCVLWLLIPTIEMERMQKEPTDPCTQEEFQAMMQTCREYKKKGNRTDLGFELMKLISIHRKTKYNSLFTMSKG